MNKRIQELAEQAYDTVEFNYAPPQKVFNKEKFAELIVRECVELLHQRRKPIHSDPIYGQGWVDGRVSGVDLIEKHFGVEDV